ncbi:MAG: polyphosphate kinase 1, partial [Spirochaetaceae bacterium]|jgi:polyphosphate kinase|nr:polyphosphate kinase 1 [Spirochaetaceae bacterium]
VFGERLFPGYSVQETLLFKVTRDADFSVDENRDDDFIEAMEELLEDRRASMPVKLVCNSGSSVIQEVITSRLGLSAEDVCRIDGTIDLATLSDIANIEGYPHLKNPPWRHIYPPELPQEIPLWDEIKRTDVMLHLPYQSYEPVLHFINEAADDHSVLAIKMTLYRTSGDSPLVHALERAARNGKQVTAFVELKARFDEKQNISWADRLEKAGVIVVYGIARLKVHAKMLLVVRREPEGIRRYVHLSTGNYNDKTAKLYSDISLFTSNQEIANDATLFFNMISGYSAIQPMKRLFMAPINLKSQLLEMIEREMLRSTQDTPGLIMAKMNSLADPDIIEALYRASSASVRVMLNVRGICMLVPGVKGQSENITVVSIIGRYLEHSRIFYFQNGGAEEIYLSSADWMPRNLDRRVELMFPVLQETLRQKIQEILRLYFSDNTRSHYLQSSGEWRARSPEGDEPPVQAQQILYGWEKTAADSKSGETPREFVVRRDDIR